MGKFLQSLWDSIRDSTSLKEGLVALKENKKKKAKGTSRYFFFKQSKAANKNALQKMW